jgi:hypothetical protein
VGLALVLLIPVILSLIFRVNYMALLSAVIPAIIIALIRMKSR